MTVGELVAMRQLGCQTVAGAGGLDHPVTWAHCCELSDPWNWLSPGELLMTTGICVPAEEEPQQELVRQLSRVGVAGVAIGENLEAPPLTAGMLAAADQLDFPVVRVSVSTPFSAMGRTVAAAGHSEQVGRLARLSRLYDVARSATMVESSLLDRLSEELGYELHVVDVDYRTEVMKGAGHLDVETIRELCRLIEGKAERLPARIAIDVAGKRVATAFPLTTHRACMLVATSESDVDLDAFVVLHTQSLIGIEVEQITRQRERDDTAGEALFRQIIDGTLGFDAAQPRLEQGGLADREWAVCGFDASYLSATRTVLGDRAIPSLSAAVGEEGYVLIGAEDVDPLATALASHVPYIGVSARSSALQRLPDSVRQARWALQAARADGSPVAEYSTATPLFLPRTISEALLAARAVLGELMDHDDAHQSQLIDTLEAFLDADRSWQTTAAELMIHRQTLAYRLRKIESLTGRSTKNSADIAAFWMALVARRIARGGDG